MLTVILILILVGIGTIISYLQDNSNQNKELIKQNKVLIKLLKKDDSM